MSGDAQDRKPFIVEIIKPSHYDDDGYVIRWFRAFVPSNSLACIYGLAKDVADRQALGPDVELVVNAYDESHTMIPVRRIIRRIQAAQGRGVVLLAGVQSNQMPRAIDLAQEFRAAGVPVVIGGFHVSGCLAMLPELPADLQTLHAMGVTLFAGEAEGRLEGLLRDVYQGSAQPIYNYLKDLPDLQGQVTPTLPADVLRRYMFYAPVDCGRGCPFNCSFCTIINVQGRKSRFRAADDIEQTIRAGLAQGTRRFFLTDDNMSRNRNWSAIFDRLIEIRQQEGIRLKLVIQVDTQCHKIPGFIEKARRAGVTRVFIGLENINPANLAAANKPHNKVSEYRAMLQAWRAAGTVTYAGYILGLPSDTPESIERDIRTIQRELPIDILQFMILTPLPGSADHQALYRNGTWMDPDLNKYDVEHVTANHPLMSSHQWQEIYHRAWHLYYSWDHVRTLLRRAKASGTGISHVAYAILSYYGSYRFEGMHPLQCGLFRRRCRTERRPGLPRESFVAFHLRNLRNLISKYSGLALYFLKLERLRKQVISDPRAMDYTDDALASAATDDEPCDVGQAVDRDLASSAVGRSA